jgi:hypothetical protein
MFASLLSAIAATDFTARMLSIFADSWSWGG